MPFSDKGSLISIRIAIIKVVIIVRVREMLDVNKHSVNGTKFPLQRHRHRPFADVAEDIVDAVRASIIRMTADGIHVFQVALPAAETVRRRSPPVRSPR